MKKIILILIFAFSTAQAAKPVKDAFSVVTSVSSANTMLLTFKIKPHHFLYQDRIALFNHAPNLYTLGTIDYPKALDKIDKTGKSFKIYRQSFTLPIYILAQEGGEGLLDVSFQGCSNEGFCYPPQTVKVRLTFSADTSLQAVNVESETNASLIKTNQAETHIDKLLSQHHWSWIILSCLGLGLLLSCTPCMLPMIPVLSGILVGQHGGISTRKALLISLSYVLSMSLTYSSIGLVFALLGSNLQVMLQSKSAIGLFALLFALLALSMFDVYQLRLPTSWNLWLSQHSNGYKNKGIFIHAIVLGALSTLILSPCVTAPLVAILTFITKTGQIILGCIALFCIGLGMGAPLLVLGTSLGKWVPKSGPWMHSIKAFFGFLLLGVSLYLLQRLLPSIVIMVLWASLTISAGIYFGHFHLIKRSRRKTRQLIGLCLSIYGLMIAIGACMGNTSPLYPLASNRTNDSSLVIANLNEVNLAVEKSNNKPLLLYFYADWCTTCKNISRTILRDKEVMTLLSKIHFYKIDLTANNEETNKLLHHFGVVAPPTFLFYPAQNHKQPEIRLVGEISAQEFINALEKSS